MRLDIKEIVMSRKTKESTPPTNTTPVEESTPHEHTWGVWQGYRVMLPDGYQKWKFRVCESCGGRDKDVMVYTTER
jgi:hypothetical protein